MMSNVAHQALLQRRARLFAREPGALPPAGTPRSGAIHPGVATRAIGRLLALFHTRVLP
jgi:hypothetical protein